MADREHEINSFVQNFKNLWKAGFTAHLDLDTQGGQAWVGLRLHLGAAQVPFHQHDRKYQQKSKNSPAKEQRCNRREALRKSTSQVNQDDVTEEVNCNTVTEAEEAKEFDITEKVETDINTAGKVGTKETEIVSEVKVAVEEVVTETKEVVTETKEVVIETKELLGEFDSQEAGDSKLIASETAHECLPVPKSNASSCNGKQDEVNGNQDLEDGSFPVTTPVVGNSPVTTKDAGVSCNKSAEVSRRIIKPRKPSTRANYQVILEKG